MADCIFCRIVKGDLPSHKIWEDEKHLSFLSIFPNTPGFTVVVTKAHFSSDLFSLPDEVFRNLVFAARETARLINSKLDDVGRTGLIIEGLMVDHAHIKLFPMHGTKGDGWEQHLSEGVNKYFEKYEGYISSHNGPRASAANLAALAQKIRE